MKNVSREVAAQVLMGGADLYGFTEADFQKADGGGGDARIVCMSMPAVPGRRA